MLREKEVLQIILVFLIATAGFFAWQSLKSALNNPEVVANIISAVLLFLVLIILLGIDWILNDSKLWVLLSLVLLTIGFFIAFGLEPGYFLVWLIVFILGMIGFIRAQREKEIRLKISPIKFLSRGLPILLTGLVLAIATAYYFSPTTQQLAKEEIEIPRSLSDTVVNLLSDILGEQFEKQLSNQLDLEEIEESDLVDFDEKAKNDIHTMVNEQVNLLGRPHKKYFPWGAAVVFFFAIKLLSIPLAWVALIIAHGIFYLMIVLKVIKIGTVSVEKEIIEM